MFYNFRRKLLYRKIGKILTFEKIQIIKGIQVLKIQFFGSYLVVVTHPGLQGWLPLGGGGDWGVAMSDIWAETSGDLFPFLSVPTGV